MKTNLLERGSSLERFGFVLWIKAEHPKTFSGIEEDE